MNQYGRERGIPGIFFVLIIAVFTGLTWRIYDLKTNRRSGYVEMSQGQQQAVVPEDPRRGMILDCQGRILAASATAYNVFIDEQYCRKMDLEGVKIVSAGLQEILQIPGCELYEKMDQSKSARFTYLQKGLSQQQYQAVNELRMMARKKPSMYGVYAGIGIQEEWKRQYPAGNLTSHLLGFVGRDNKGLEGLELLYDSYLTGSNGKKILVIDALRRPIAEWADASHEVTDGNNLVLTIDSVIQRFVYEAVKQKMQEYEAESAIGVVMDPWTGAILAMVSLPDFEPSEFSTAPQDSKRNRVLTDPYEPGSIFKPIVAAIALDTGAIDYDDIFFCENGFWPKYRGIHDFEHHSYGNLSVREIIMHSSNIGMAKIGLEMSRQQLYDGLRLLGFSEKTGVDLPGEDPGLVWSVRRWSTLSITRIPFGHEVLVTPLQICRAYSIFANGGYAVKPHIVRAVVDNQGNIVEDRQPAFGTAYVMKKEVANWMVQTALSSVVNEGTGDKARLDGCQVWGKTGTANIALPTGGYDTRNYVTSFVGGAPAKDPAVVVLVSIRKPNRSLGKGYSGGRVAAPIVHDILENTLTYLGVLDEGPTEPSTQLAQIQQ